MKATFKVLFIFSLIISLHVSCESEITEEKVPFDSKQDYEETIIASHQVFLKKEKERINHFIDSTQLSFEKTGTGLQYVITKSSNGDTFNTGDIAVVRYQLESIRGELFYETRKELAHEFAVDFDEVETGLHEAIKFIKVGEEAIVILPAHLAHGITGDQAAIKSQTTLVYYLTVVGKK